MSPVYSRTTRARGASALLNLPTISCARHATQAERQSGAASDLSGRSSTVCERQRPKSPQARLLPKFIPCRAKTGGTRSRPLLPVVQWRATCKMPRHGLIDRHGRGNTDESATWASAGVRVRARACKWVRVLRVRARARAFGHAPVQELSSARRRPS
eukprot:3810991-Pleurochrysis_carterae.AAC.5